MPAERGDRLTDRQEAVLAWLYDNRGAHPPSHIAYGIGMDQLPAVTGSGSGAGRGSGHRVFNPAQRIISSLTGLVARKLVGHRRRPDGRSGVAYAISDAGARRIRARRRSGR